MGGRNYKGPFHLFKCLGLLIAYMLQKRICCGGPVFS